MLSLLPEPLFSFFCRGICLLTLCQHFSLLPYYSYMFFTHTDHVPPNIQSWIWNTLTYLFCCIGLLFTRTLEPFFLRRKMFSYVCNISPFYHIIPTCSSHIQNMHLKIYSHGYEIHELTFICVLDSLRLLFFFCGDKCWIMLCQHFSLLPGF